MQLEESIKVKQKKFFFFLFIDILLITLVIRAQLLKDGGVLNSQPIKDKRTAYSACP